jgi:hypothetical protein
MFRNITRGAGLASMASAQALLAEKKAGTNPRWQTQRARGAGFLAEQPCDGRGDGAGVVAGVVAAGEVSDRDEGDAGLTELAQAATAAAASTQAAAARAIAGILAATSTS